MAAKAPAAETGLPPLQPPAKRLQGWRVLLCCHRESVYLPLLVVNLASINRQVREKVSGDPKAEKPGDGNE